MTTNNGTGIVIGPLRSVVRDGGGDRNLYAGFLPIARPDEFALDSSSFRRTSAAPAANGHGVWLQEGASNVGPLGAVA